MAGKCEHGLTTRECMVCASPKYGAETGDKWVTIPRARLAELEAAEAEIEQLREQLDCVRQALPEALRNSVPSVAVATMAAGMEHDHAVMRRLVAGIDHLDKLTREWEPDHSSGADRCGWLLAKNARDDAARLLGPNVRANLDPTAPR